MALQLAQAGHAPPPYKVVSQAQPTAPYAIYNVGFNSDDVTCSQHDLKSDYTRLKRGQNLPCGDLVNPAVMQPTVYDQGDYMRAIVRENRPEQRPESNVYMSIAN